MITEIKTYDINEFPDLEIENRPEIKDGNFDCSLTCYCRWEIEVSKFTNFADIDIKITQLEGYLEVFDEEESFIGRIDLSKVPVKVNTEHLDFTDSIKPQSISFWSDGVIIHF